MIFRVGIILIFLCGLSAQAVIDIDSIYQKRYTKNLHDSVFVVGDLILCPDVQYDFDKMQISEESVDSVKVIADFLKNNPFLLVELVWHSDHLGSNDYNKELSLIRAQNISDFIHRKLNYHWYLSERITPVGKGEEELLIPENYIDGFEDVTGFNQWRFDINSRIELKITGILSPYYYENKLRYDSVFYTPAVDLAFKRRYSKTLNDSEFVVGDLILAPEIIWDYSSSRVRPESREAVEKVIAFYRKNPLLLTELHVHTDCLGDPQYNLKLALLRAQELVSYMLSNYGSDTVFTERFIPVGKGENDPLIACDYAQKLNLPLNESEQYRNMNIRVEIKITGFLGSKYYTNKSASVALTPDDLRNPAYYEDLILIADKALLEGNLTKALEFYSYAADVAPANENYAAQQREQVRVLLNPD